jgi:hypothetical protein
MWFPSRSYSHSAALAWNKERVAVLADSAFVNGGQTNSCGHRYSSGGAYVALCQLGICFVCEGCLLEEDLYALSGYLLCG